MKTQLLKLKAELKVLAEQNRKSKQLSRSQASFMDKNYPLRWSDNYSRFQNDPQYLQVVKEHREAWNGMVNDPYSEYRAKHIAYCLLRGRTLEQIEPKVRGSVNDYHHWRVRKEAARIVAEVLSATAQPQAIPTT